jgi:hypothetical protein
MLLVGRKEDEQEFKSTACHGKIIVVSDQDVNMIQAHKMIIRLSCKLLYLHVLWIKKLVLFDSP